MAIPYITIGCPTIGGGNVITGNSSFLIEGIAVACIGDKATCPKHQTTATIVSGDPYMQVMGKSVARVNDSLSCGCKLLPKQSLVVGATGPSNGGVKNTNQNV
ncbi:PAAR domain-containing protein [Acinetobacter shaoyimingii]|uniref:PAAR domain-containing protein n=1 Tax=Acinetobacter shaoyimingii TaxID=2715164 RepID=A0A6G8S035_9GAMM|nr:PAAR domain-containing protein [Acinetobacter shaoyimingii]QIO07343.1 PAAR domain-containing protein [Acinetobacter shaoyimingii]